jgi:hypothetical protein
MAKRVGGIAPESRRSGQSWASHQARISFPLARITLLHAAARMHARAAVVAVADVERRYLSQGV